MTNNGLFNYNRKEYLKTWQPMPNMYSPPEVIEYYNHKVEADGVDITCPINVLSDAEYEPVVDINYLKHILLLHMDHLIKYIKSHGVVLGDIRQNIRSILNEIINDEVDEDYYLNTIDIYEGISGFGSDAEIYHLIDQAIRLDNMRMIYYLIFKEDEYLTDRLSEVIKE